MFLHLFQLLAIVKLKFVLVCVYILDLQRQHALFAVGHTKHAA